MKLGMYFAVSKLHIAVVLLVYVKCLSKRLNWYLFIITIAFEMSAVCLALF